MVTRSIATEIRPGLSYAERWGTLEASAITAWEQGRVLAIERPDLAKAALAGQLPVLAFKGGLSEPLKRKKYGCMEYLAMWQGLRGEDLQIDLDKDVALTCSAHGSTVTFTPDATKYAKSA
jgi:hypothetical protein